MREFAALYAALDATTSTRARREALAAYLARTSAADAAWAVWFLCGGKPRQAVPTRVLRETCARRAALPDWLFEESYQAVGDLAETIALLLPPPSRPVSTLTLAQWVEERLLALRATPAEQVPALLETWWDELDAASRFVWNKLITGGFRVGVSRQTVVQAVAVVASLPAQVIAERLAGDWTPTAQAWRALVDPNATEVPPSRPYPFFLAQSLVARPQDVLGERARWVAEWKWDGIRAQLVCRAGEIHLWSRGEESITARFPEVAVAARALPAGSVLDGELVAWRDGEVAPFSLLQRRIGLVRPGAAALARAPVVFIAWDLLEDGGVDLRAQPWTQRRAALEARLSALPAAARDVLRLSPTVEGAGDRPRREARDGTNGGRVDAPYAGQRAETFDRPVEGSIDREGGRQVEGRGTPEGEGGCEGTIEGPIEGPVLGQGGRQDGGSGEGSGTAEGEGSDGGWAALERARASARERRVEGLMLKRVDSAYGIGRSKHSPEGEWWKWKLDPLSVDAVLVYAQRGHGRRASLYTDYTFAVWHEGALVPFAKAYSGLADAEIREVDAFIRRHTVERFGPVRSVTPQLVCEIGFEGIGESPRHKSGIAVRFPRILRLRHDKTPQEADTLARLRELAGVPA